MSSVNVGNIVYGENGKMEGTFYWKISNFSQLCPETATTFSCTWSSPFSVGQKDGKNLEWTFWVYPYKDCIGCVVSPFTDKITENVVAEDKPKFISCSYKIGFGNKNNPFVVSKVGERLSLAFCYFDISIEMQPFNLMKKYNGWGTPFLFKKTDLYKRRKELLQQDTLRVTIHMEIDPHDTSSDLPPVFKDLFTGKFSDCEIKCGESSFPCHKLILSSRSSVFNRMFESRMEETVKGQVVIEDMEPAAVETLLKFIYTGQMDLPENCSWTDLIHGAEKYELMDLKDFCFKKMLNDLTMDNFGALYVAAHSYNAGNGIKNIVMEYRERNLFDLLKNPNFRDIFFKNPKVFYPDYKD